MQTEAEAVNGARAYEDWLLRSYYSKQMENQHSKSAIAWRKLYLSRAKLKASSNTSALLSGFAMVALVEIGITEDVSYGLLIAFSICTTLLVSVHLLALMISTCILPNIEAVSNVHNVNAVNESPHQQMQLLIQMAWAFSTGFGIILFLAEIVLICWIKFNTKEAHYNKGAAYASTIIVIPVAILLIVFAFHFYKKLVSHKYEQTTAEVEALEKMAFEFDNHDGHGELSEIQTM